MGTQAGKCLSYCFSCPLLVALSSLVQSSAGRVEIPSRQDLQM